MVSTPSSCGCKSFLDEGSGWYTTVSTTEGVQTFPRSVVLSSAPPHFVHSCIKAFVARGGGPGSPCEDRDRDDTVVGASLALSTEEGQEVHAWSIQVPAALQRVQSTCPREAPELLHRTDDPSSCPVLRGPLSTQPRGH